MSPKHFTQKEEDLAENGRKWKHFLAGGSAAIVSRTVTAPLERLKIIAQVSGKTVFPMSGIKMMFKEGGITSMWRGNGANLLKVGIEIASRFLAYNEVKHYMTDRKPKESKYLTFFERVFAGGISGALAHSIVHPLEVLKTRLSLRKTGEQGGLIATVVQGFKVGGIRFFYRGYITSIFGIVVFCSIDLSTYQTLKDYYLKELSDSPTVGVMTAGMCSSFLGQLGAYPISVIGVYLQISNAKRNNIIEFVLSRGFFGMYAGLTLALIKTVPTISITYLVYETALGLLGEKML